MAKVRKLSAESIRLNAMIEFHGLEKVMAATGWQLSTLNQYMRGYNSPNATRLDIAEKVLASNA